MRGGLPWIAGFVACASVGATAIADAASNPDTREWFRKSHAMFAFADRHDRYLVPARVEMLDRDQRNLARFRLYFTALEKQSLKPATDGVLSARWTLGIPNPLSQSTSQLHSSWAAPAPSVCSFTNIPCRYVTMMASGFSWGKVLVPTATTELGTYRSCPQQTQIGFKAYDLTVERFLQPANLGLISTRMVFPLTPFLTREQITDCVLRRRMEPV